MAQGVPLFPSREPGRAQGLTLSRSCDSHRVCSHHVVILPCCGLPQIMAPYQKIVHCQLCNQRGFHMGHECPYASP